MAMEFQDPGSADSGDHSLGAIESEKPVPGKLFSKVPDQSSSCKIYLSGLRQLRKKPLTEDIRCDKCFTNVREEKNGTMSCCMCEQCFCIHCASGLVDQIDNGTRLRSSWWNSRAYLFPVSLMHEILEVSTYPLACKGCLRFICHNCVASAPWCACSYCAENYTCVNCLKVKGLRRLCHRVQEGEERRHFKERMEEEFLNSISELAHTAAQPTPPS